MNSAAHQSPKRVAMALIVVICLPELLHDRPSGDLFVARDAGDGDSNVSRRGQTPNRRHGRTMRATLTAGVDKSHHMRQRARQPFAGYGFPVPT